jgi:hypothetical protein
VDHDPSSGGKAGTATLLMVAWMTVAVDEQMRGSAEMCAPDLALKVGY